MIRAVVDTNVLVRYLIRPGASTREMIEELWLTGAFRMVTAPVLIAELEEVLARPRIQALITEDNAASLLAAIQALAEIIDDPEVIPPYTRDPKDDKFVACAIAGRAEYLVTEDRDILVLDRLMHVSMVTPYAFVGMLGGIQSGAGERDSRDISVSDER